MKISIIVAVAKNNVIGKKGSWLLWHIPEDLKHFKETTMGHHILMGRKTFESIGRVLPGRTSLILTTDKKFKVAGAFTFSDASDAVNFAKKRKEKELFVIGGGEIYKIFFPLAQKLYLTKVFKDFQGDIFFPEIDKKIWKEKRVEKHLDNDLPFEYATYEKK